MTEYRVREALIEICDNHRCWHERRFIAERRISIFGFSWWYPVIDCDWRKTDVQAIDDAQRDACLRSPLSKPKLFEVQ